jgi:hypothetical protein
VATAWADPVRDGCPGAQPHNGAGVIDFVDDYRRQLREQNSGKITNARAVTITDLHRHPNGTRRADHLF